MLPPIHNILSFFAVLSVISFESSPRAFPLLGENTGCGGRLTSMNGTISTPRYPQKYPRNTVCVWILNIPDPQSTIEIKFESFMLESHPSCRYDYLLIRDGDSQLSPVIGKFCGSNVPKAIYSRSNRLWIRFYSDSAVTGNGFKASYSQQSIKSTVEHKVKAKSADRCGGNLTGSVGEISSPRFPNSYPDSQTCTWIIENNNLNSLIEIAFEQFSLEYTQQCLFDYVTIEDMSTREPRLLGRFCGTSLPSSKLTGQKLRIIFRSDESGAENGFRLKWNAKKIPENPACGYSKTSAVGFLRSSNYPENYEDGANCRWKLSAPGESKKIQLRFANFDVEYNSDCSYDYIDIYDGDNEGAPRIGRFCGRLIPDLIETTQKDMLLVFRTDGSDTKSGFEAAWVAVVQHDTSSSSAVVQKNRIEAANQGICGGLFTSSSGTFATPNHPKKYSSNAFCTWAIKADEKHHVRLRFTAFNIEKDPACVYDKVVVRDGADSRAKLIGEFCGNELPKEIISSGESLWIHFKSDDTKELTGFTASWQFIRKSGNIACGTTFEGNSGELSSPGYPLSTTRRNYCSWTLKASPDKKIKLIFKDIDVKSSASCSYSFVQIFDGSSEDFPDMGRFCRDFLPRPIMSSSNKLFIGFQPDGLSTSRGFKVEWEAVTEKQISKQAPSFSATPCNSNLTAESGNIILAKGLKSCSWLIQPSSGKQIKLSVIKANLIPNPSCDLERLYVHNGFTTLAPILLKICGHVQAKTITPLTNVLRIHYEHVDQSTEENINLFWTTEKEGYKDSHEATCGRIKVTRPAKYANIVNIVEPGVQPWIAALLSGSGMIFCGASIISTNWLITAAHCVRRYPLQTFRKIIVGELNLFKRDGTEQILDVKLVHIHPNYNPATNENDIALINLEGKIILNDRVNTICLPSNHTAFRYGTMCMTAGWGTESFLGRPSKPLVLARIPLVSKTLCNSTQSYEGKVKENMICAGRSYGGVDTCQGDGGGPLICEVEQGQHVLTGISSWGNGCGFPNKYGVYTEVKSYLHWISSILEN